MNMKKKARRVMSGLLTAVTVLSTVLSPAVAYASDDAESVKKIPYYEEIKDQLDEDEVVTAKDYEIKVGDNFDVKSDYTGLTIQDDSKVTVKNLPYQEARQQNVSITVENYRLISIHEMQENEKVADIWKRTKNQCEVSDVLVLNKNGEISCYYVDENYPQYLAGFIRINTSGALITMETENYQIDGKKGNWIATDTIIIDGKQFYLMEHQVYRDQAQGVILDAYGKMVVEECKKFDEKTKQKIHDYIQQQVPLNPVEQLKQDGKIRLEHYQKFYQNGTYERSRESGTEANYDMVDGLVNNQKKNLEKISDARNNKQTSRNQQNNKPKKRRSVIKRLHQKQIAIARRSGKPIPKYLDQEMERKRG